MWLPGVSFISFFFFSSPLSLVLHAVTNSHTKEEKVITMETITPYTFFFSVYLFFFILLANNTKQLQEMLLLSNYVL